MADALLRDRRAGRVDGRRRPAPARADRHRPRHHQLAGRVRATTRTPVVLARRATGGMLLPSVVHYATDGAPVVGARGAARRGASYPRDTIVVGEALHGPRARGRRDDARASRPTSSPAHDAAGGALRGRRRRARSRRSRCRPRSCARSKRAPRPRSAAPLDGAVITVPAYFDDAQRQATQATPAGSPGSRCCACSTSRPRRRSPTASTRSAEGTFAVYDLGGGTFDISILKLDDGVFEVKSTGGDTRARRRRLRSRARRAASLAEASTRARARATRSRARCSTRRAQVKHALTDDASVALELASAARRRVDGHARASFDASIAAAPRAHAARRAGAR